jgi:hypothetical protein
MVKELLKSDTAYRAPRGASEGPPVAIRRRCTASDMQVPKTRTLLAIPGAASQGNLAENAPDRNKGTRREFAGFPRNCLPIAVSN